jgi:hypothetical protein
MCVHLNKESASKKQQWMMNEEGARPVARGAEGMLAVCEWQTQRMNGVMVNEGCK